MDEDASDALDALDHDGLVALLDRMYAKAGEPRISRSTALASTDDELRDAIGNVRRRFTGPLAPDAPGPSRVGHARRARTPLPGGRVRLFCVLFTVDADLLPPARAILRSRGVPVVAVATSADLAALAVSAMPSHLVVDERCGAAVDLRQALGSRGHEVSVVYAPDGPSLLAAVAAIAQ